VSPVSFGIFLLAISQGCARPECAQPAFDRPECRVAAEAQLATLTTSSGVQVWFAEPGGEATERVAAGLIDPDEDGGVDIRLSGLGGFRIVFRSDTAATLPLRLENVDPRIATLPGERSRDGLVRHLEVPIEAGRTELQADLPDAVCAGTVRLAAAGDVQTNPLQFRRVVEALHAESEAAEAAGEPLLGLIVLGDLSEYSGEDELRQVRDIARLSPLPVAVVPGNHDVYDSADAVYNRVFGPGNHAFTTCGVRMALLDTGSGFLADSIRGRLPELLEDPDARHRIAAMHHPPDPGPSSAGWSDEAQARHLLAELAARDTAFVLAGHVHRRMLVDRGDVPVLVAGTLGANQAGVDPDYGFLRLRFGPRKADACFVGVAAPGSPGVDRFEPDNCQG
jgi:hypothetical protein